MPYVHSTVQQVLRPELCLVSSPMMLPDSQGGDVSLLGEGGCSLVGGTMRRGALLCVAGLGWAAPVPDARSKVDRAGNMLFSTRDS